MSISLANSFSHDLLLLAYFITSQFLAASIPYYHASSLATCYISFLIIPSHPHVASPLTLFLGFLLLHWFSLSFPLATWCVYHVTNPFLLAATLLILSTLLQLLSNQPCCWHDFRLLGIRTNCWSDKRTQWSILVGSILVSTAYQTVHGTAGHHWPWSWTLQLVCACLTFLPTYYDTIYCVSCHPSSTPKFSMATFDFPITVNSRPH